MTRERIRAIEENTFAYCGGIARLLEGQFTHTFISQSLPFFWADWPDAGTPGLAEHLNATGIPFVQIYAIPAMARKLDSLPLASLPKEVEIIRVENGRDQENGLNVMMDIQKLFCSQLPPGFLSIDDWVLKLSLWRISSYGTGRSKFQPWQACNPDSGIIAGHSQQTTLTY